MHNAFKPHQNEVGGQMAVGQGRVAVYDLEKLTLFWFFVVWTLKRAQTQNLRSKLTCQLRFGETRFQVLNDALHTARSLKVEIGI